MSDTPRIDALEQFYGPARKPSADQYRALAVDLERKVTELKTERDAALSRVKELEAIAYSDDGAGGDGMRLKLERDKLAEALRRTLDCLNECRLRDEGYAILTRIEGKG